MEDLVIGNLVNYGWNVGSYFQLDPTPYIYRGKTLKGKYILENIETGGVFLASQVHPI